MPRSLDQIRRSRTLRRITRPRGWRRIARALPTVVLVVDIVLRVGAVLAIPYNRRPTAAMAWLVAIFASPIPGTMLFGLLGSSKLPKDRREKQVEINQLIIDATDGLELARKDETWPEWFDSAVELNRTLGAMPLVSGNDATLLPDYTQSIASMTEAIRSAKRYVHVEFYILTRDDVTADFFQAMADARARGVVVRVLYDHIGTARYPFFRATKRYLRENDIDFREMLPFHPFRSHWRRPDLRNHRKVVIVDGDVAFLGSQNLIDPSYNKKGNIRKGLQWKDLMVRLEGPIVGGVNAIFATDWYSETNELLTRETDPVHRGPASAPLDCQIVPSGPGFEGENNLRLFNTLLYSAQERLVISSPYFVPDDSMLYAITTAAERGVEVQLFACEVADQTVVYHAQRSYYETLLRAGVRIFLYRKPIVLHAKHFTVDDDIAVVGSSNMDMRSFSLNYEVSMMVHGKRFVDQLREIEDDYRANSRELHLDEWLERPIGLQVIDNIARLTSTVQ